MMSARERLPNRRAAEVFTFEHHGRVYVATVGRFLDGRLAEIFLDTREVGAEIQLHASDAAVLASLALQHGATPEEIAHSVAGPIATALKMAGASP